MYPNFYYLFRELFGIEIDFLYFINTFGFFFALAFLSAYYILRIETKRKEKTGIYPTLQVKVTKGLPASYTELTLNFLFGFFVGFKILSIFFLDKSSEMDIHDYIFSTQGNVLLGLIFGSVLALSVWYEKNKKKLPKPIKEEVSIPFSSHLLPLFYIVIISAIVGAKVFHNLEYYQDFIEDPWGSLFSFGGLTFFGGIIVAFFAVLWYLIRKKMPIIATFDTIALAIILAYGVGRLGCHFSGDGDWGILNSAYITKDDGKTLEPADTAAFKKQLKKFAWYYATETRKVKDVRHASFNTSGILPANWVANSYAHNVINNGVAIFGCKEQYCKYKPIPVFPTSLYETVFAILTFIILFMLRKKITKYTGLMLAIYFIWNGFERFFIEKIRVNVQYHLGSLAFTQAELISVIFVLIGLGLMSYVFFYATSKSNVQKQ